MEPNLVTLTKDGNNAIVEAGSETEASFLAAGWKPGKAAAPKATPAPQPEAPAPPAAPAAPPDDPDAPPPAPVKGKHGKG